jgi:NAD(P)-dependent dehydrogenase (short-subunit alcohol dehydrogenase family)
MNVCKSSELSVERVFANEEKQMNAFKDKTAIVTGGASGIGRAVCMDLAKLGAIVTVADINEQGAVEVAKSIVASGGRAKAVKVDVSVKDEVQALVNNAGRLDYMFNNAGIAITGELFDTTDELWQKIIKINLWSVIHGSIAAYEVMRKQGSGHIINTASMAGLTPIPMQAAYVTTKHAIVGFTNVLRSEAEACGVKASVVCPGMIDTPIIYKSWILNARIEELEPKMPITKYPVEKMSKAIIRGVRYNQAVIIAPYWARILWKIYQLCPGLMAKTLGRKIVRDFRSVRHEP